LVWVGQASTVVLTAMALAWIPMMELVSTQIYQYLQSVQAYISPPIAAVFLLGILWKRVNSTGAIAALATGFVLGIARLVIELNKQSIGDGWLFWFGDVNFLHFALFLFIICSVVLVLASFARPMPPPARIAGLTLQTDSETEVYAEAVSIADAGELLPELSSDHKWRRADLVLSLFLAAVVGAIWIYFTG
jgi:SSS family solute:Na+ symporter